MAYFACIKKLDDLFNTDMVTCDQLEKQLITDDCSELKTIDGMCMEKFNRLVNEAVSRDDELKSYSKQIENVYKEKQQETMKLEEELKGLEDKLNKLTIERKECENYGVKPVELAHFETLKSKIKVYKRLMNVHFSYESQTLTGYIKNESNLEVFDFDDKKMPPEEIVEKYWNEVEAAAGIDCKQIANNILNC